MAWPYGRMRSGSTHCLLLLSTATPISWAPLGDPEYSRQDGGERDHLGSQVRDVGQEEDEERLDDAHALGEPRDQGQQEGEEQPHGCAPQAHQEEGGWREEKSHVNHKEVGPTPVPHSRAMLGWPIAMFPPRSPPKHPMEHKALDDLKASLWSTSAVGAG